MKNQNEIGNIREYLVTYAGLTPDFVNAMPDNELLGRGVARLRRYAAQIIAHDPDFFERLQQDVTTTAQAQTIQEPTSAVINRLLRAAQTVGHEFDDPYVHPGGVTTNGVIEYAERQLANMIDIMKHIEAVEKSSAKFQAPSHNVGSHVLVEPPYFDDDPQGQGDGTILEVMQRIERLLTPSGASVTQVTDTYTVRLDAGDIIRVPSERMNSNV